MSHPDQKYITALLTNNTPLLHELYQKFSGKIKLMVLRNGGTEGDARDVFQEALLAIYKKTSTSEFSLNCPLDAFLYLVCKNKWQNELRKRTLTRVTFTDTESYSMEESDVKLAENLELEKRRATLMREKLASLGESCRRLLLLCWGEKSLQEAAASIGMTYGYARKRKSECMARLIALIKTDPEFENLKW
jgi:RNA polymerase sigma factor (sigma-70 family)